MMLRVFFVFFLAVLSVSLAAALKIEADSEAAHQQQVTLPGYREQISNQLRNFAQASYCSVDSVTKWECPVCKVGSLANFKLTNRFWNENTNTFGFAGVAAAAKENVIIFSFRGATPTQGRNWITDLNAQRIAYPGVNGGTVHKGFYTAYLSIARQVNRAARSLLASCQKCHIYITGHSLGGAIATLVAADLYQLSPDITLYTFGAPRVGDETFAAYFDNIIPDTFRVVHNHDLVPKVPQRFLGFRHTSREVWYPQPTGNSFRLCNGGEDDACSNSIDLIVDENAIKDHATYLDQPMGCRPADLNTMGLITLMETNEQIVVKPTPFSRLQKLSIPKIEAAEQYEH